MHARKVTRRRSSTAASAFCLAFAFLIAGPAARASAVGELNITISIQASTLTGCTGLPAECPSILSASLGPQAGFEFNLQDPNTSQIPGLVTYNDAPNYEYLRFGSGSFVHNYGEECTCENQWSLQFSGGPNSDFLMPATSFTGTFREALDSGMVIGTYSVSGIITSVDPPVPTPELSTSPLAAAALVALLIAKHRPARRSSVLFRL